MRIVFFGTPEFASAQLENLIKKNFNIVGVVTTPDKPAGRGKKLSSSAVKKVSEQFGIPVLQPEKFKDETFLLALKNLNAEVFIVIAFRMLPEVVWKMPPLGTFNLHASLLPQYRGAAPINRAIMNGENETGLTTFFINDKIDNGNVILQKRITIGSEENAGELHDKMIEESKELIISTIDLIASKKVNPLAQDKIITDNLALKEAPKIFKSDCKINWSASGNSIFNHIRGLSPYPGAYATFISPAGNETEIKIYKSRFESCIVEIDSFILLTDNKSFLKVALPDGFIFLELIQQPGKKVMTVKEFLQGFHFDGFWNVRT